MGKGMIPLYTCCTFTGSFMLETRPLQKIGSKSENWFRTKNCTISCVSLTGCHLRLLVIHCFPFRYKLKSIRIGCPSISLLGYHIPLSIAILFCGLGPFVTPVSPLITIIVTLWLGFC